MDSLKPTKKTKKKPNRELFECTQCPKRFSNASSLRKHGACHSDGEYACAQCEYTGRTVKYLRRHVRTAHGERRYKCDECGKSFHYGCKLRDHMRVHTGEKPNKCDVCGKAFNSAYSLSTHKLIHTDSKPYQCAFCEYACRDSSTLRKHQARHMGTETIYQCKMCHVSLKNKWKLKLHVAEKHMNIDIRTHICDTCGKRFKLKSNLVTHIQAVHERTRTVKCELCGVVLSNRGNLNSHMRIHVDHRPYVCTVELCGRRFKHTSSLSKHVITHFPSKWFPCKICDRRFTRRKRLVKHLATHQAKVKRVECDYCGVRFYNKNYLARHIHRKHTKKKQKFICDMCDFVTTNKPSIVMHIKYGHAVNNSIQCKMCEKQFKRDFNLKLHYWNAHGIKYKITIKKKPKKPVIVVKTEPEEFIEESEFMQVIPKIEPLDDEGMLLQEMVTASSENQLHDISKEVFEEFINPREKRPDDDKLQEKAFVDKPIEEQAKKQVKVLLERTRQKIAALALERTRRKYNRLMRNAVRKSRVKARRKIKYYNNNINNERNDDPLLEEDYSISHKPIEETEQPVNKLSEAVNDNTVMEEEYLDNDLEQDEGINNTLHDVFVEKDKDTNSKHLKDVAVEKYKDTNNIHLEDDSVQEDAHKHVEDTGQETRGVNEAEALGRNRKLKINTHQCYVCFQLFETKEKLLDHCKDHFELCNIKTLKKCPLCEYATNLSVTKHLQKAHGIHIKIPYANLKDKANNEGSRYYYDVGDDIVNKVEIIPSVKNLNRQAYMKIDKSNRDAKNKGLTKTKLVKKGKEWIVVKEKLRVNDYMLPKFDKIGHFNVKGDYVERMKVLSRMAKKNGTKILFPCNKCDKICQTLSALKLHGRKHEANPKPYKPKVWKHKIKANNSAKNVPEARNDHINKNTRSVSSKTAIGYVKRDRRKRQDGITNEEYRVAPPKPVDTKHRCKKELIEFYERNIKGGDIEFWQFLKIYNKLGRENVNDFTELEKTTGFGVHGDEPKEKTVNKAKPKRPVRRDAFKRIVTLSKKEVMSRNEIRENLREKLKHNSS